MNAQLDPYLDWLQIPVDRQPPTHYELLGLPAFLADAASAQAAATSRIAHVRKFQLGVYSDVAIRVMGEISRALTCLSDPVSKRQYDAQLRGTATIADDADSLETRLVELLTSPEPTPVAKDEGFPMEPLPADLAGSSPNRSLDKLAALVSLVESPPQSELQPVGADQPAVAAGQQPLHSSPALPQNTRILVAAAIVVAATLLLLAMGGWMLSGSKDSNQAASGPEPTPPPAVPSSTIVSKADVTVPPSVPGPGNVEQSAPSGAEPPSQPPPAPPARNTVVVPLPLPMPPAPEDPGQPASPAPARSELTVARPAAAASPPFPDATVNQPQPLADNSEISAAVEQAVADVVEAVKASKKTDVARWRQVVAALNLAQRRVANEAEQELIAKARKKLEQVAKDRIRDAIFHQNNQDLYQKFVGEAMVIDAATANEMLAARRRLR